MKRLSSYLLILLGTMAFLVALTWTGTGHVLAQAVKTTLSQDVDNPGRHPFQTEHSFNVMGCALTCSGSDFDTVPAGQRLVIDHVSVEVFLSPSPSGQKASASLLVVMAGGQLTHVNPTIPLVLQGGTFTQHDLLVGTLQGPFYADEGTKVTYFGDMPEGTNGSVGVFVFDVTGHFITCPC